MGLDVFTQLNLHDSEDFINNYKDVFDIDNHALDAEAIVLKNILKNKRLEINLKSAKKKK